MDAPHLLIAGAGLSGAVIARDLAEAGLRVTVHDTRPHVAGNCHTLRDPATGILLHLHGPHIFHTDDADVWAYVQRFARFRPFRHRVRTTARGQVYSLPIHLGTLRQFYGDPGLDPEGARARVAADAAAGAREAGAAENFEAAALRSVGRPLYETFLKGYTEKQWGVPAAALPASILRRLPLRFTADDSYFDHPVQAMPEEGYTAMVAAMLDHPAIALRLAAPLAPGARPGTHVFWTGPLDAWFPDLRAAGGGLAYRTLRFERIEGAGDLQGCAVMNYADADVPWTRIAEHKHFAPWEDHARSVAMREYSADAGPGDVPYYPLRLQSDKAALAVIVARAEAETGVTFAGRLGTYRYLDMDRAIREARDTAAAYLEHLRTGRPMPVFLHRPL